MCATGLSVTGGQGQGSHCGPEWAGMALWRRQGLPGPCERRQDSGRWSGERRAFRVGAGGDTSVVCEGMSEWKLETCVMS